MNRVESIMLPGVSHVHKSAVKKNKMNGLAAAGKSAVPFEFVVDELQPLHPEVRRMFGFAHVYLGEKLLISLRRNIKKPAFDGVWLYTEAEHIDSLRMEFPDLPRHCFWKSKKGGKGWVIIRCAEEKFEEYVLRVCEMILKTDRRVGRIGRREVPRRFDKHKEQN